MDIDKFEKKRVEKNMKNMSYDNAVSAAKKQARLLEIATENAELFEKSIEICKQMAEYVQSSEYNQAKYVEVALYTEGTTVVMYNNQEILKEVIELATNFSYFDEKLLTIEGKNVKIIAYDIGDKNA